MSRAAILVFGVLLFGIAAKPPQNPPMTFFITSQGSGNGAALGGLDGADRHCHTLAAAARPADSSRVTWRAYLSTIARDGKPAVHARERIGRGPWHNANGAMVARNGADLHGDSSRLSKEVSVTEQGGHVNGRGDQPNMHDILTGSQLDGTAYTDTAYTNCDNWTTSGAGKARVGHHDRTGGGQNPTSWNSAHNSRGCGQEALRSSGGNGLFYCFGIVE